MTNIKSMHQHFDVIVWYLGSFLFCLVWCQCRAKNGIEEMCRDLWNWASNNPYGYNSSSNGSSS